MNRKALLVGLATLLTAMSLAGCSEKSSSPAAGTAAGTASETKAPAAQTQTPASNLATATSNLGEIIVDGKGMTAYVFDKDVAGSGTSACTGDCQKLWPAIVASSDQPTVQGISAPVGVITGASGEKQITVAGLPLYTYNQDKAPGETTGQLFKGVWHVVTPAGQKVG